MAEGAVVLAGVAGLGILTMPYLAHRFLESARNERGDAARALADTASATATEPLGPRASYEVKAAVLESNGDAAGAAQMYGRAATLAREPFADHLNEARAARLAGAKETAAHACRAALLENPYVADAVQALCPRPDGRVWPLRSRTTAGTAPFAELATSAGCGACSVAIRDGTVTARVPGGFAFRDSALGILDLGAGAPARRDPGARPAVPRTDAGRAVDAPRRSRFEPAGRLLHLRRGRHSSAFHLQPSGRLSRRLVRPPTPERRSRSRRSRLL